MGLSYHVLMLPMMHALVQSVLKPFTSSFFDCLVAVNTSAAN